MIMDDDAEHLVQYTRMRRPVAIGFDLCHTLFRVNDARLPLIMLDGVECRSTSQTVYEACRPFGNGISFESFHASFISSWVEAAALREQDQREITSEQRFRRLCGLLAIPPDPDTIRRMLDAHAARLAEALELPAGHRAVLEGLHRRFRLALITNFDHAPTVYRVLEREGIRAMFDAIVISAEVGWRKPNTRIFQAALDRLGLDAEAMLFVGDDLDADVRGAQALGIDAVWLNNTAGPSPIGAPTPDMTITRLHDLLTLVA